MIINPGNNKNASKVSAMEAIKFTILLANTMQSYYVDKVAAPCHFDQREKSLESLFYPDFGRQKRVSAVNVSGMPTIFVHNQTSRGISRSARNDITSCHNIRQQHHSFDSEWPKRLKQ
jgi:hypothetical protein